MRHEARCVGGSEPAPSPSRGPWCVFRGGSPGYEEILITIHGSASRKNFCWTMVSGTASGSQPGSTRSTTSAPSYPFNTPGSTSTTPLKTVGSQTAPTLFGKCALCVPRFTAPRNAPEPRLPVRHSEVGAHPLPRCRGERVGGVLWARQKEKRRRSAAEQVSQVRRTLRCPVVDSQNTRPREYARPKKKARTSRA